MLELFGRSFNLSLCVSFSLSLLEVSHRGGLTLIDRERFETGALSYFSLCTGFFPFGSPHAPRTDVPLLPSRSGSTPAPVRNPLGLTWRALRLHVENQLQSPNEGEIEMNRQREQVAH